MNLHFYITERYILKPKFIFLFGVKASGTQGF